MLGLLIATAMCGCSGLVSSPPFCLRMYFNYVLLSNFHLFSAMTDVY
jgi:hypothetical protein